MNKVKPYRDSLLSALCVISWVVIVFRIFTSPTVSNENLVPQFIGTWVITIIIGIIGGITIHFLSIIKMRKHRHSFIYNFLATQNIIVGTFGIMLPPSEVGITPYLMAASLTIGVIMYKHIYAD